MPGSGKSTVGLILAKIIGFDFLDTDIIIQRSSGKKLHEIINEYGIRRFLSEEEKALLSVGELRETVVATGGSAVFSKKGMDYLKRGGTAVYLEVPLTELVTRISNMKTRGIAAPPGQTMEEIFFERKPYYEKYSDITVSADGAAEETAELIHKAYRLYLTTSS